MTPTINTILVSSGQVGLVMCPGRSDLRAGNLAADLDAVRDWGAAVVLTLVESHELLVLGVPSLRAEVAARGMVSVHLPVRDMCAPDHRFEAGWKRVGPQLHNRLDAAERVLIHCRGGVGRAGTVACRILVEGGVAPAQALAMVRAARDGAVETAEQEAYVMASGRPV
jgi:ADP-ribosyl-[dinitrogen reductase] hydrolase